jgi:hypothetical protein
VGCDEKEVAVIISTIVPKMIIFLIFALLIKKYCTVRKGKRQSPEELHRDLGFPMEPGYRHLLEIPFHTAPKGPERRPLKGLA